MSNFQIKMSDLLQKNSPDFGCCSNVMLGADIDRVTFEVIPSFNGNVWNVTIDFWSYWNNEVYNGGFPDLRDAVFQIRT